jgi:hypothetical protein
MKKLLLALILISSTINANWLYDTVNAIDDAGIAVSGVIVDGVNGLVFASLFLLHTSGGSALGSHTQV